MPADAIDPAEQAVLCPICRCATGGDDALMQCPACQTPYHAECWEYNGGCGTYGCPNVPQTERLANVEVAAAYWGQEDKICPVCGGKMLAAAIRCRHCGTTFESARPQGVYEFRAQGDMDARVQRARWISVWLLILGVLPCTAPLVAIAGTIWYFTQREPIRRLSPARAALCVIGVAVACLQTAVTVVATLFYGVFGG